MAMNENNTFSTDTRAALNAAEQSDFSFDCTQNDGQPLTLSTLQKQAEGLSETRPSAPANRKKVAIVATGGTIAGSGRIGESAQYNLNSRLKCPYRTKRLK